MDVSKYLDQKFNQYEMKQIRLGLPQEGFEEFIDKGFQAAQLQQIRLGIEKGIDVSQYAVKSYQGAQMEQIRLGLQTGLDVTQFNHPAMSSGQMQEIRHTMMIQNVLDKIKEQLKKILDAFCGMAKLYISFPNQTVEKQIDPVIQDILSARAEEIVEKIVLELEARKEPENAEEVVQYVQEELEKEEVQEQILSESIMTEMEEAAQEALEEYAEQQEENHKIVEEWTKQVQEELNNQKEELQEIREKAEGDQAQNIEQQEESQKPAYHENPVLNEAMKNYILFRQEIGKPLLNSQIFATLAYLENLEPNVEQQAQILNQSVMNGWMKLYPVKETQETKGKDQSRDSKKYASLHNFEQRDYDFDALEKKLLERQLGLEKDSVLEGTEEMELESVVEM